MMKELSIAPCGRKREAIPMKDAAKRLTSLYSEIASKEREMSELEEALRELREEEDQIAKAMKDKGTDVIYLGPACIGCQVNEPDSYDLCEACQYRIKRLLEEGKTPEQIAQKNQVLGFRIAELFTKKRLPV